MKGEREGRGQFGPPHPPTPGKTTLKKPSLIRVKPMYFFVDVKAALVLSQVLVTVFFPA